MIQRELYATRKDGVKLYRTYSDANKYIKKAGKEEIYSEAIDVENAPYKYEETEVKISEAEGDALQAEEQEMISGYEKTNQLA